MNKTAYDTMGRVNDVAGVSVEMENKILSLRDAAEMFVKSMRAM